MKPRLTSSTNLIAILFTLIVMMNVLANAQSGQIGFSSVITDKSSGGIITNAYSNVLEDSRQSWNTNSWSGYFVHVTDNNGINQIRKIVSNTAKTITVSPAFSEIPNTISTYVIRRGYKQSTTGLKLKLYVQYNDANQSGGRLDGYSCRIQASDTTAVEFVSVEQGVGLGKAWMPNYYAPPGKGQINWLVVRFTESQPLASGLYHIATVTYNLLKTETDKALAFYISNCPDGGLPIGSTEDNQFLKFDTTTNNSFSGKEEIFALNSDGVETFTMGNPTSSGTINSFPNPFNPTTTLRYELTEYSEVHLVIFDMLGRLVGELVNSHKFEGIHSIAWEPNNLSSGTYFARLSIQGFVSKQKDIKTIKLAYTK